MESSQSKLAVEAADPAELYELKEQAATYYADNGVPEKMEEILNAMFYDNPKDVYGHLANYFETFAKPPVISKLLGRLVLDGRGQTTIQTEVYCTVKNHEKLMSTFVLSNESYPHDSAKQDEKENAEEERKRFLGAAIDYVNTDLSEALSSEQLKPDEQERVDDTLLQTFEKLKIEHEEAAKKELEDQEKEGDSESIAAPSPKPPSDSPKKGKSPKGNKKKGGDVVVVPDESREELFCGCNAMNAVSTAVCMAAANVTAQPLYRHLAQLRYCEVSSDTEFRIPLPMVTIFTCGKPAPGKMNCVKEYMVIPKPGMPMKDSIKHINGIYSHCAKTLSIKGGQVARNVTDNGALMPSFDRPEQGIDMLQDAMTVLELTPGEDFHIALNCAGQEIFDYEKGKYEVVAGQMKAAEDIADFWGDLLSRYPAVIALIDPLRKQEKESWLKLCESVSEKCYVIGDAVYHRPGLLKDEELDETLRTSAISLKLEHMNTVSDIVKVCKKMEDADNQIVISSNTGESPDTFIADLAVGVGARFLRLGGPTRGERVAKLNRMLQIEAELEASNALASWGEHEFPIIRPPTPPPDGDEAEGEASEEGAGNEEAKKSESDGAAKMEKNDEKGE